MRRPFHRRAPPGAPPGTLVSNPALPPPRISLLAYGKDSVVERPFGAAADLKEVLGRHAVIWVNVDGLGDAKAIAEIGEVFGLHPLALEDVLNVHQRAKVDEYGPHLFFVARMIVPGDALETEQVSLFLGPGFVLTFQERPGGDPFEPVRDRIRKAHGHLREAGPDYLAYALLDAVIDAYFPFLESLGDRLEGLEDSILARPAPGQVARIRAVKRDLRTLRRAVWPLRDALNALLRESPPGFAPETRLHLRDLYDHASQILDLLETYREQAADLMDVYLSTLSFRINEVMKVLTIIATIFIPLTFIAGVYGMNFDRMPELRWRHGYPLSLLLMAAIALGLVVWFRGRGWIGRGKG